MNLHIHLKKVWLNIYNSGDNFLGSTYQPLLQKYDDLLNLDIEYIAGDGQTESNITNRLGIQASMMHLQSTWLKQITQLPILQF